MRTRILLLLLLTAVLTLTISAAAQEDNTTPPVGPTLNAVQSRGQLNCMIDSEVYGFGFLDANTGEISGIQVDLCRALAVATVGEVAAVNFGLHPLNIDGGALNADASDVVFDHTTLPTLAQARQPDLEAGRASFFYDGPTLLVEAGGRIAGWDDLENTSVCIVEGSASAQDFAVEMQRRELDYDEAAYPTIAAMKAAFLDTLCTAQVLDRSLLEIVRSSMDSPGTYVVWPMPFNAHAITPLYHYGDPQWADIVDWTIWGLIDAEKLGVTSANVDDFMRQPDETDADYVRRVGEPIASLLDDTLGLGSNLTLSNGFMAEVIRQVGNYGEIYDRYLGPESALTIERGLNALWMDGGLLDAPAWR